MAEKVETGGVMRFEYQKGSHPKMNKEQKKEIEDAYEKAKDRKDKDAFRKRVILFVILLLLVSLGAFFFLTFIH